MMCGPWGRTTGDGVGIWVLTVRLEERDGLRVRTSLALSMSRREREEKEEDVGGNSTCGGPKRVTWSGQGIPATLLFLALGRRRDPSTTIPGPIIDQPLGVRGCRMY